MMAKVASKTTLFVLPWLLWLCCLAAIFFVGRKTEFIIWFVALGYGLWLLLLPKVSDYSACLGYKKVFSTLPFAIDLAFYGWLLYMHGGASNGGVSILYVPIITAAIQLNRIAAWCVSLGAIAVYTLLMGQGHAAHFDHLSTAFADHLFGMWVTFVISTWLITWFITGQRRLIIDKEQQIHQLKERQLRDEQIIAVATTAANTAHNLATPLSTASLLIEELVEQAETVKYAQMSDKLAELNEQIVRCQQAVHQVAQQARNQTNQKINLVSVVGFLQESVEHWWVSRNEISYQLTIDPALANAKMNSDFNLQMSLASIFENASFASAENNDDRIEIYAEKQGDRLVIKVDDFGLGIAPLLAEKLGQAPVTTKDQGMGFGLVLANATIERMGGQLELFAKAIGTRSQLELPLAKS